MSQLNVDVVEVLESEWIKIGADTGQGKTAWPWSVTYGKRILVMSISLSNSHWRTGQVGQTFVQ